MSTFDPYCLSRRSFVASIGSFAAWSLMPRASSAAGQRDPRFLTVILRGALDGLATVAPVGDPAWQSVRDDAILLADGPNAGLGLDPFFVLNPAMPRLHRMYGDGEALVVHAVASPYRERSHFDGQDMLENGLPEPGRSQSGWLNRAVAGLRAGERVEARGLAVGPYVPLILQGKAPVTAWAPLETPDVSDDTEMRLLDLYQHTDLSLHRALNEALATGELQQEATMAMKRDGAAPDNMRNRFARTAAGAARLMAAQEGPRVAALSFEGWDTHAWEGPVGGRLFRLLDALDAALGALRDNLGEAWKDTVVAVVTEFGRTVRENGTDGTDHGTATVALLLGGAVKGGRILADWPGLRDDQLYMGRDLAPTTDLRAVLKGVLRDHLGLEPGYLGTDVFPGSLAVRPMEGLVRA